MKNFFGIFGKKKDKMKRAEKKNFLSNDFIERMIRVEQRVSISLGDGKPYNQTNYYKSLTPSERRAFGEHLIKKGNVKKGLIVASFLLLISVFLLNFEFTGNAVSDTIGMERVSILTFIVAGVFIVILVFLTSVFLVKKHKDRRFHKHFKILDRIGLRKIADEYFS